jgi:hypothetical protein
MSIRPGQQCPYGILYSNQKGVLGPRNPGRGQPLFLEDEMVECKDQAKDAVKRAERHCQFLKDH